MITKMSQLSVNPAFGLARKAAAPPTALSKARFGDSRHAGVSAPLPRHIQVLDGMSFDEVVAFKERIANKVRAAANESSPTEGSVFRAILSAHQAARKQSEQQYETYQDLPMTQRALITVAGKAPANPAQVGYGHLSVSQQQLRYQFHQPNAQALGPILKALEKQGLIEIKDGNWYVGSDQQIHPHAPHPNEVQGDYNEIHLTPLGEEFYPC